MGNCLGPKAIPGSGHETTAVYRQRYRQDRTQLGEGRAGHVFTCTEKSTKKLFACKNIAKSNQSIIECRREVAILTKIRGTCPHIIQLQDVFEDTKSLFLVTELCQGGELYDQIVEKSESPEGAFSEFETATIIRQMMLGVEALHTLHQVTHRDLKPENFLLLEKGDIGQIRMIDFGLSRFFKRDERLRTRVGTVYYTAPEVWRENYDESCDLWSLGVIMYVLLCSYPPFDGDNDGLILKAVNKSRYSFPSPDWDEVSTEAKDLIRALLSKQPSGRPTAAEALDHEWFRLALGSGSQGRHSQGGRSRSDSEASEEDDASQEGSQRSGEDESFGRSIEGVDHLGSMPTSHFQAFLASESDGGEGKPSKASKLEAARRSDGPPPLPPPPPGVFGSGDEPGGDGGEDGRDEDGWPPMGAGWPPRPPPGGEDDSGNDEADAAGEGDLLSAMAAQYSSGDEASQGEASQSQPGGGRRSRSNSSLGSADEALPCELPGSLAEPSVAELEASSPSSTPIVSREATPDAAGSARASSREGSFDGIGSPVGSATEVPPAQFTGSLGTDSTDGGGPSRRNKNGAEYRPVRAGGRRREGAQPAAPAPAPEPASFTGFGGDDEDGADWSPMNGMNGMHRPNGSDSE
mmetsp:Transcript_11060/g.25929  ORF Transcript_11060/g.25929 Transcript_11060/m.25929 type:complete len:634 (+) Transcript_11060:119-2020(+)